MWCQRNADSCREDSPSILPPQARWTNPSSVSLQLSLPFACRQVCLTPPGPRRPLRRAEGRVHWDIPPSCEGSDWRGTPRSSAGPSPSSEASARSGECCACGSWCSARTPAGTSPGTSRSFPYRSGLSDLHKAKKASGKREHRWRWGGGWRRNMGKG